MGGDRCTKSDGYEMGRMDKRKGGRERCLLKTEGGSG